MCFVQYYVKIDLTSTRGAFLAESEVIQNLFVNASVGMCSKSDITTNKSDIHTVFVLALIEFTQGGAFLCTKKNY